MNSYRDESKRFQTRDSPLTRALRHSGAARGTYSCLISLACLVLIRIGASYTWDPRVRHSDWLFLNRSTSDFHHFAYGWLTLLFTFTLIGCSATKIRVTISLSPFIYFPIVAAYMGGSFVFVIFHNLSTKLHVSMGLALGMEHVRMLMKMISFVAENERKLHGLPLDCDPNQTKPEPPTFKSFLYFMFAPTLIYRDRYPRAEGPFNYRSFATWSVQCVCNAWVAMHLANQVGNPSAKYVGLEPVSSSKLLDLLSWSFIGGAFTYLITIGYGYLHCFCNAFAEVLRFGDRRFYGNWWSASNMFVYFGKWNFIVNAWLAEYIYKPVIYCTGSRSVAVIVVFAISGFFHDYIMSVTLGFVFTIWSLAVLVLIPFFMFWMRAAPQPSSRYTSTAEPLPMQHESKQRLPGLNISCFLGFFFFLTFFSFFNAVEYFAHENCAPYGDAWYWTFVPRFITCIRLHMSQ